VPKVQHKPVKKSKIWFKKKGANETKGSPGLAHRTVSSVSGWINSNSLPSGFRKSQSAIITGLSGVPYGVTSTAPTVVCKRWTVRGQFWEHLEGGWIGDPVKFNTNSHKTWLRKLERLSSLKLVLVNIDNQIESTQATCDFYPVVQPSNNCLLPRCGVPMDEDCTQPPFKWSNDQLEYHDFSSLSLFPFARNLHKLESLSLTTKITMKAQE
jgi:hypothetical protein